MTPVTKQPQFGTQYRRVPSPGTQVVIRPGKKSRDEAYAPSSPYRSAPFMQNEQTISVRRALLNNSIRVTATSMDSSQDTITGALKNLTVNGIVIPGPVYLPVRDLYRVR